MKHPWSIDPKTGVAVAEESDLSGQTIRCPKCEDPILPHHSKGADKTPGGDFAGWRFECDCGQKILVIND